LDYAIYLLLNGSHENENENENCNCNLPLLFRISLAIVVIYLKWYPPDKFVARPTMRE